MGHVQKTCWSCKHQQLYIKRLCSKNIERYLIWEKIGTCDHCVDENVTN